MNLLAFGDVCGETGLRFCEQKLRGVKRFYKADYCIVNGENADVLGIRPDQAERLHAAGVDVITLGNHTWNRPKIAATLEDETYIIRPYNLQGPLPGQGYVRLPLASGRWLCMVNLIGRLSLQWDALSPFTTMDTLLRKFPEDIFAVDFHGEATSEKNALGHYLDGRAACVFGTHTHVQTSDAKILPGGTGFITDLGMTGACHSVLGVKVEQSVKQFLGAVPERYEAAVGDAVMEGAFFCVEDDGTCSSAEGIRITA